MINRGLCAMLEFDFSGMYQRMDDVVFNKMYDLVSERSYDVN